MSLPVNRYLYKDENYMVDVFFVNMKTKASVKIYSIQTGAFNRKVRRIRKKWPLDVIEMTVFQAGRQVYKANI